MGGDSLTAMGSTEYLAIALFHPSPILLHVDTACTLGTHGMQHRIGIACDVIPIGRGCINGNDLFDDVTGMSDDRNSDLSLHIA